MIEEWFRCDYCSWYEDDEICLLDPGGMDTLPSSRCRFWTCKNCEGDWSDGENHSNCMTVYVELDN